MGGAMRGRWASVAVATFLLVAGAAFVSMGVERTAPTQKLDSIMDQTKALEGSIFKARLDSTKEAMGVAKKIGQYKLAAEAQTGAFLTGTLTNRLHNAEDKTFQIVRKHRLDSDDYMNNAEQGVLNAAQAANEASEQVADAAESAQQRVAAIISNAEAQSSTMISAAASKASTMVSGAVTKAGSNFGSGSA